MNFDIDLILMFLMNFDIPHPFMNSSRMHNQANNLQIFYSPFDDVFKPNRTEFLPIMNNLMNFSRSFFMLQFLNSTEEMSRFKSFGIPLHILNEKKTSIGVICYWFCTQLLLPRTKKKRTIPEIRGEKNTVPSCEIMLDHARSAQGKSCGLLRVTLPCADHLWSSMISQDRTAFFSPRISRMVFFLSRVV